MISFLSGDRLGVAVTVALILVLLLAGALAGDFLFVFSLRENAFDFSTLMQILGPAIVTSLFVERAVEIFVSSPRKLKRQEHEDSIARLRVQLEKTPQDAALIKQMESATAKLNEHRQGTLTRAVLFSLFLSFLVALIGVRLLAQFFEIPYFDCLTGFELEPEECPSGLESAQIHFLWLTRFDIFLTTLIISGGSEGLHSIVRAIVRFADNAGSNSP